MPRLGGILLGCIVSLCSFMVPAKATETLLVQTDQALAFPIPFQAEASTEYHVKVRFAQDAAVCEPKCDGLTRSTQGWASQSVAWVELPTVLTDSNGFGVAVGTGKYAAGLDTNMPTFAQVAIRKLGTSSTRVIGSYPLHWAAGAYPLQLEAYTDSGQPVTNAYIRLRDGTGEQIIPIGYDIAANTSVSSRSIELELFDGGGRLIHGLTRYELQGDGAHIIQLNAAVIPPFHPFIGPVDIGRPYQPVHMHVQTDRTYSGAIIWYRDGQKITETGSSYEPLFETSGKHIVTAVLPATREKAEATVIVESYPNVMLASLIPNPQGNDSRKELITIKNGNAFAVKIQKWTLKNRATNRTLKIEGIVTPFGDYTVNASSFLTNGGGTFDLYNESNQIVDTTTYPAVGDDSVVTRNGIIWRVDTATGDGAETALSERVSGIVTKPSGNTIDIDTEQGPVHIVVHHSFDGQKPRLAKGDIIAVSGIWLRSSRGPYLSVRKGDTFVLVESSNSSTARKSKSKKKLVAAGLVTRAQAAGPSSIPQAQAAERRYRTITLDYPTSAPYNPHLRWLFITLLAIGSWLILDTRRQTSK